MPEHSAGRAAAPKKRGNTRQRLIETTLSLLWQYGYGAVGVDRICKDAGVNKGSFYHFFPSKEGLVIAALEHGWQVSREGLYRDAFDPALHPLDRFNQLADLTYAHHQGMRDAAEWKLEQGCPFGNVGAETGADDRRVRDTVRAIYEAEAAFFEQTLRDAVAVQAIRPCDISDTARMMVAWQTGLLTHAKVYNDAGWLRQLVPGWARLLGVEVRRGWFPVPR
ncbi:MAG: TetR/AcrR family transcriptional regulator [Nitrospirota bacterium]|nr:TetR/AcrR family transcriptional regulator [Nitrospirota bacterium]